MRKVKKQNGFTLIEMLIVVAIIAILIAVSIPLVGTALERAREATDAANERAAKAEILLCYMTDSEYAPGKKVYAYDDSRADRPTVRYYAYDAANGTLTQTAPTPYGKCTKHNHTNNYLVLWMMENGEVFMVWTPGNFPGTRPTGENYNLCGPKMNG